MEKPLLHLFCPHSLCLTKMLDGEPCFSSWHPLSTCRTGISACWVYRVPCISCPCFEPYTYFRGIQLAIHGQHWKSFHLHHGSSVHFLCLWCHPLTEGAGSAPGKIYFLFLFRRGTMLVIDYKNWVSVYFDYRKPTEKSYITICTIRLIQLYKYWASFLKFSDV